MTVLRMIMPASAMRPSSATKPNGRLERSNAPVAPISPSGAVTNTKASREKLCSWIISSASIATPMTGNTAASALLAFTLSSIDPPVSMR